MTELSSAPEPAGLVAVAVGPGPGPELGHGPELGLEPADLPVVVDAAAAAAVVAAAAIVVSVAVVGGPRHFVFACLPCCSKGTDWEAQRVSKWDGNRTDSAGTEEEIQYRKRFTACFCLSDSFASVRFLIDFFFSSR